MLPVLPAALSGPEPENAIRLIAAELKKGTPKRIALKLSIIC